MPVGAQLVHQRLDALFAAPDDGVGREEALLGRLPIQQRHGLAGVALAFQRDLQRSTVTTTEKLLLEEAQVNLGDTRQMIKYLSRQIEAIQYVPIDLSAVRFVPAFKRKLHPKIGVVNSPHT